MKLYSCADLCLKKIRWNDLFPTEQALIDGMMNCLFEGDHLAPRGYVYLESFKRYYRKNGKLTPPQLTQLKRLAKPIYAYLHGMRCDLVVFKV